MSKIVLIIISVVVGIVIIWFFAIRLQMVQRIPIAEKLIDERLEELESMEFDKLVELVGKGYIQENTVVNGVTYYMGYVVSKPNALGAAHSNSSADMATQLKPGEHLDKVEINGYVDCITIVPIIYLKIGPSFNRIIER